MKNLNMSLDKNNIINSYIKTIFFLFLIAISSCRKDVPILSPAKFSIDQSSINFNEVEVGSLKNIKVTVTNTGDQDLVFKDHMLTGANASEFGTNLSETETVQAGKDHRFTITFKPIGEGDKVASLTIISNIGEHQINLSGSAIQGVSNATVNIPDENFRASLLGHGDSITGGEIGKIDANDDGEIQVIEATTYSGTILCNNSNISDLTGIEAFINIKALEVGENQLTNLDLSKNVALESLVCYDNQLTDLNLSQNTALEVLSISRNKLTSLDVSQNTALEFLNCEINQLTSLDVSNNVSLNYLIIYNNQLTDLDVSQNTALWKLSCQKNQITSLDVSKNTALKELFCDDNNLTSLDVSKNIVLKELFCDINKLTNLDISQNTELVRLSCNVNQLTNLNVSQNTVLEYLACTDNQLSYLDVSGNAALTSLFCYNNQLGWVNLANGNNISIEYMKAQNNPGLSCIQIDSGFTPPDSWSKDESAGYSTGCP